MDVLCISANEVDDDWFCAIKKHIVMIILPHPESSRVGVKRGEVLQENT